MSIATEEADKKYPEATDVDDPMYKYVEAIAGYPAAKRQGYVAGRTAEITEEEVNAAVRAMHSRHADYCESDDYWESAEDYARSLLEAARKAVTE